MRYYLDYLMDLSQDGLFVIMNKTTFASYADDNMLHFKSACWLTLNNDSVKLLKWFSDNQMKANKDKCYLLISNKDRVTMEIRETEIKLTGIKIDYKLDFNQHLNYIIDKASRKVQALSRVAP